MPVSIGGSGFITGLDQGIDGVGIITATSFSGPLTGNVTGDLTSSGVSTVGQLNVGTGGTVITTTASGRIGIGTDNPLTKTHIDGASGDNNSTLLITASDLDANNGGIISLGGNYDGTNRTTFAQIKGLKDNNTSGEYGGYLSFLTRTNGQSPTERLRIDSSGRVTMPYQVYFYARAASANHVGGTIPYSLVDYNIGNHYNASTYNFTAPVAGVYNISCQFFSLINAAGGADLEVNGVLTMRCGREGTETYYEGHSNSINKYLNVGDTVRVQHFIGSVHTNTPFSHFSAYLLG